MICVACRHRQGIWRDPEFDERWLCDDCFIALPIKECESASERAQHPNAMPSYVTLLAWVLAFVLICFLWVGMDFWMAITP
jgi:hypothetical protein